MSRVLIACVVLSGCQITWPADVIECGAENFCPGELECSAEGVCVRDARTDSAVDAPDGAVEAPDADVDAGPDDAGDDAGNDAGNDVGDGDAGNDNSLLAHYTCDELTDAILPDVSGNGHDGSCVDGCPAIVEGVVGMACEFDGTGPHIVIPYAPVFASTTDAFTVMAWVNLGEVDEFSAIVSLPWGSARWNSWQLFANRRGTTSVAEATFVTTNGLAPQSLGPQVSIVLGTWVHLAMTFEGGTKTAYQDGAPIGTDSGLTVVVDGHSIYIGADESEFGVDLLIQAKIDEVRIYDRALSVEEIRELSEPPP